MNHEIKRRGPGRLATCWACLSNNAAATLTLRAGESDWARYKDRTICVTGCHYTGNQNSKCNQPWHIVSTDIVNTNLLSLNISTKITFASSIALMFPIIFSYYYRQLKILLQFLELITWQLDLRQKPVTWEYNLFYGCGITWQPVRKHRAYSELKANFDSPFFIHSMKYPSASI
jgi:hypothetical protein